MEIDIIQIRCTEINNEIILYIDIYVNLNTISSNSMIKLKRHYISVENKNIKILWQENTANQKRMTVVK
ncbi:hypothetical protein HNR32_000029 [Pectinatus brassicae]|uniref:Uncharacterized protein n=1 Tax=Pectinatus brassicae TaxID=862415 RepID=A0A840UD42_9FIRM|nr:hypothetical protein [Pectinatus brassicae]